MTLSAEKDAMQHMTIFDTKVFLYPTLDVKYKGRPVSAFVEHKKITNFIHSLSFQTEINLNCMVEHNKNFKLFFRIRDDILAHFHVPATFDENCDNPGTPPIINEVIPASDSE